MASVAGLIIAVNTFIGFVALDIGERELLGIDDYIRLQRLRDLLDGHNAWFDGSLRWSNTPFGTDMHWSRAIETVVLAASTPLAPFVGWTEATYWGALLSSLVFGLGLAGAVYWAARGLLAPRPSLLAAAIAALQPAVLGYGRVGHVDHHIALAACVALLLGCGIRLLGGEVPPRVVAAVGGVVAAAGVWISPEALIGVALLVAALSLDWLIRGTDRDPQCLSILAAVWTAASLFFSATDHGPAHALEVEYDRLSAPHVVLALGVFVGATTLWAIGRRWHGGPLVRCLAAACSVAAGLLVLRLCGVSLVTIFTAPESVMPQDLVDQWLYQLPEFDHVGDVGLAAVAYFAWPLAGFVVSVVLARHRDTGERLGYIVLAGWILSTLVLGLWAVRLAIYAQTASAIAIASVAWLMLEQVDRASGGSLSALRRGAITTAALLGYSIPAILVALVARPAADDDSVKCGASAISWELSSRAAQQPPSILTHLDMSALIHYATGAEVVATGHHRNVEGMRAVRNTLHADPATARIEVERRGIDFIAVCDALDDTFVEPAPTGSLFRALASGEPPDWLVEVPLDDVDSRLYGVVLDS